MILNGARRQWSHVPPEPGLVDEISERAGCSGTLAGVLVSRGVASGPDAMRFLSAASDPLPDAHLLPDAARVTDRIERALDGHELIAVHGHDDPDGITATVIMVEALRHLGAVPLTYIPDRKTEGHGLSRAELDRLHAAGVNLIVTVDSCVSDREFIAYAKELGIDTIVTDHHEIPPELPPAVAIVNPKLPDDRFPYRYMAGVGVSLRVADLLMEDLGGRHDRTYERAPWCGQRWREEALALAAIGSVSDRVPLTGDNRAIVTQGLSAIPRTERTGLRTVLENTRLWGEEVEPDDIREFLGPVLGRFPGDTPGTQRALDLLLTKDEEEAAGLASDLIDRQTRWKEQALCSWRSVRKGLGGDPAVSGAPVLVLESTVPIGVMGYVTSRLADELGKPTVLMVPRNSELSAEARGPAGFNFVDAFASMRELFIGYGGHPRAAGFSMNPDNAGAFRRRFVEFAESNPPEPPPRVIDAQLPLAAVTPELAAELDLMRPFGQANHRPLFLARAVTRGRMADAESSGVRFGTPPPSVDLPADMVYRLRDSDGVALVSFIDSIEKE
jgi:single-stranded-DNA-specific exonuclease